jgi:hypothetical protein
MKAKLDVRKRTGFDGLRIDSGGEPLLMINLVILLRGCEFLESDSPTRTNSLFLGLSVFKTMLPLAYFR